MMIIMVEDYDEDVDDEDVDVGVSEGVDDKGDRWSVRAECRGVREREEFRECGGAH